jgi:hypothetical protein
LPTKLRLPDRDFVIEEGKHVFFELTTQSGDDLQKEPWAYIRKKVEFHRKLLSGEAFKWKIDRSKHVLVFCFNGADHVKVNEVFTNICSELGVYGTTVYIGSDVIDQWSLDLTNGKLKRTIAEKDRALAEKERLIDDLKRQLAQSRKRKTTGEQSARKNFKVQH